MQDSDKLQEKMPNHEEINPQVTPEKPADFEVEKKPEMPATSEAQEIKEIEQKKEELSTQATTTAPVQTSKPKEIQDIENVLAEDLEDVYFQMSPAQQAEFKRTGEETASKISVLLKQTKVKVRKVLELITKWLKMVPGLNRFFLEQEAKIKTDKILDLKEKNQTSTDNKNQNKI